MQCFVCAILFVGAVVSLAGSVPTEFTFFSTITPSIISSTAHVPIALQVPSLPAMPTTLSRAVQAFQLSPRDLLSELLKAFHDKADVELRKPASESSSGSKQQHLKTNGQRKDVPVSNRAFL